jgi:small subunit ribosomal protein S4
MARYIGPKSKIARKFNEPIFGPDKALEKKNYPPGMHGANKNKRSKQSEYAIQLKEKQKAKYTYGILERQFENTYHKAQKAKGVTGEVLLQMIESRLDNVVYRMGISPSRSGARQLVSHCHITVNGAVANIPSFVLKAGDVIAVRERSKTMESITGSLASSNMIHSWIEFNKATMTGKFLNIPERSEIPENIKEQLIVELYSK